MLTNRFFTLFVVLALMVIAVLVIFTGNVTAKVQSGGSAEVDQHNAQPYLAGPEQPEQIRPVFRQGEWQYCTNSLQLSCRR